jgi:hypothetical protein
MIVDLDDPKVWVNSNSAGQIGIQSRLILTLDRLHPESVAVPSRGLGKQQKLRVSAIDQLDQNGPSPQIAFADHSGKRPAQLRPADQGTDPYVG